MVFTKEDAYKREIDAHYKRYFQLIDNKWQAVIITITLISGFWIFALPEIFDKNQESGVLYLLLFFACFFSIIILFAWRIINHVLTDEEELSSDNIFVYQKLLEKNISNLREERIEKIEREIRENELIFNNFNRYLLMEFDNFKDRKPNLSNLFNLLYNHEKLALIRKNIYYERFEIGQWKFDWAAFGFIIIFYICGGYAFFQAYVESSNIKIFKIFWEDLQPWPHIIYWGLLLALIIYLVKFLIPIFNWINTQDRFDEIKAIIYSICPEETLKDREEKRKRKQDTFSTG